MQSPRKIVSQNHHSHRNNLPTHLPNQVYRQSKSTPTAPFLTPTTKVVELGAGTGVVGILAAMLAATVPPTSAATTTQQQQQQQQIPSIAITDMLFLDLMRKNVEMNLTPGEQSLVHVEELTWLVLVP